MHREVSAQDEITQLGLNYRLMTPYTSFVAVEQRVTNEGGVPRRVEVPVEIPDGVSYEGIFGPAGERQAMNVSAQAMPMTFVHQELRSDLVFRRKVEGDAAEHKAQMIIADEAVKLHPALLKARGKVSVQVAVTVRSPELIARLKALGLEVTKLPDGSNLIVGKIEAAQLSKLAAMAEVTYIKPL
jgi:hypothetical protein